MTDLLECIDIWKSYGGVDALRGVDLAVCEGEILGLIGANGAGKSTLVDIIGGQQSAQKGSVRLNGQPLLGRPSDRARCGLGRTFQHPQLSMNLSLRDNVAVGLAAKHTRSWISFVTSSLRGALTGKLVQEETIDAVCDELRLQRTDRKASEVSFGELRLAEAARALLLEPAVILLDEPFPGVDEAGIEGIAHALRQIARRGCAAIVIDHNVDIVAHVADRIALLDAGVISVQGTVRDTLASPELRRVYFGEVAPT